VASVREQPQANHHPRRQEEDSQPRGGQVIVARQGKGGEEGEVVCEDEQPRAGAELDERLHLAGHVVGELRRQRRPFANAQRAAKLPRPAALSAAAAPRRCGRRRIRSIGVDLRQHAADESDGEADAAKVAEHGDEERDMHVFERVEQRGLLPREDRSEALDRAPALGQASVHGRSSVARRRGGAQPAVAERGALLWVDRVGPRSGSLEQAGVP